MKRAPLTSSLREALAEIRAATRDVIEAARAVDPDAVEAAMTRRGAWIERLEPVAAEFRNQEGAPGEELIAREIRTLDAQARQAEQELRAVSKRARAALENSVREASAIRTYAAAPSGTGTLDRSS